MINLSFRFAQPVEVLLFLIIAVISGLWAYARFKKDRAVTFIPLIMINFVGLLIWAVTLGIAHDESEHLHLSWLVAQGMIPYKDVWQHHAPILWAVTAPFVKWLPASMAIFDISRAFCGGMFVVNIFLGWRIALKVWGERASFGVYLLAISSVSLSAQFLIFRPDIFMLFFLLLGISFCLDIPGKKVAPAFFAGLAFSLAASFMIKQYLVMILPVVAIVLGNRSFRPLKFLLYLGGLAIGLVPLLFYLIGNNILQDYVNWVLRFNAQRLVFSVYFPVGSVVLAYSGAHFLYTIFRKTGEPKALILLLAVCLSTFSSLTMTSTAEGVYYLSFWFFIGAVAASGCGFSGVFDKVSSLKIRAIAFGLFAGIFLMLTVANLFLCSTPGFAVDKKVVSQLMKYCAHDKCLTFIPAHPVFSHDIIRMYSFWQYSFLSEYKIVKDDVLRLPVMEEIVKARPAAVLCRYMRKDFLLDLYDKEIISALDYKKLVVFFKDNYTQTAIGTDTYYIRNDKL